PRRGCLTWAYHPEGTDAGKCLWRPWAERILEQLGPGVALDDDELAGRLGVIRQQVNQTCRQLAKGGSIVREPGWRGKIVNRRADVAAVEVPSQKPPPQPASVVGQFITED